MKLYRNIIKRIMDFLIALIVFLLLSPVFLIVFIVLTVSNDGKAFFFQTRPGKNEKLFKIIKFKTMNDKTDDKGRLLPDSQRLTIIGNLVRKTSLDEIPQLFNVLKGDMSLIGPRPFLPKYLPFYTEEERIRHQVKPGITGYAQVNGRNAITWDKKLEFDIYYVKNISFSLDMSIFFKTMLKVLMSKDISTDPSKIQPPLHIVRGADKAN